MQGESTARLDAARMLGSLSITSGTLLLCAPRTMAELYALPDDPKLCRVLGLRDMTIGFLLRKKRWATLGFALRACADGFDAALIAHESRSAPSTSKGRAQLVGALGLVLVSATAAIERLRSGQPTAA